MPNPKSLNEFMEQRSITDYQEAIQLHSQELQVYREELASERGIDLEDLHRLPSTVGVIALSSLDLAG